MGGAQRARALANLPPSLRSGLWPTPSISAYDVGGVDVSTHTPNMRIICAPGALTLCVPRCLEALLQKGPPAPPGEGCRPVKAGPSEQIGAIAT